jgi:hypothetical protein
MSQPPAITRRIPESRKRIHHACSAIRPFRPRGSQHWVQPVAEAFPPSIGVAERREKTDPHTRFVVTPLTLGRSRAIGVHADGGRASRSWAARSATPQPASAESSTCCTLWPLISGWAMFGCRGGSRHRATTYGTSSCARTNRIDTVDSLVVPWPSS